MFLKLSVMLYNLYLHDGLSSDTQKVRNVTAKNVFLIFPASADLVH